MDMDQGHSLTEAMQAGDFSAARRMVEQGVDPNHADEVGLTPLMHATLKGNRDLVMLLIAAGADPHAKDAFARTALHHAAYSGETSITVRLLMNGLDPLETYDAGLSSVQLAAMMDHEQLALILYLASRADLSYVRVLARSIAAWPSYPTDLADQLMAKALLSEKRIDERFEPLVTAFLQEIRNEKPRPKLAPSPRNGNEKANLGATSTEPFSSRRAERFTGIPLESIGVPRTWVVHGSDESIERGEIGALEDLAASVFVNVDRLPGGEDGQANVSLEELLFGRGSGVRGGGKFREVAKGNFSATINRAADELDAITIGSVTARDVFNQYYREAKQSKGLPHFHSGMAATIMLYTDDRFFRILNNRWRSQRSGELLGFSTLMNMAFQHAKYFIEGEVYRGVDLSDIDHYQQGLIFRWPFFVSASMRRDVASAFGKTLVTIEVPGSGNVREIDGWSLLPEEAEVLFRAYEAFEVLHSSPGEIRLRIFHDEFFGSGLEVADNGEVRQIR